MSTGPRAREPMPPTAPASFELDTYHRARARDPRIGRRAFRRAGAPVMVQAVWMLDAFTPDNGATRGGGANRSAGIRRALFAHYRVSPWMRFQCDPHDGFTDDAWRRLNPRQRALLRMERMEQGVGQPTGADDARSVGSVPTQPRVGGAPEGEA